MGALRPKSAGQSRGPSGGSCLSRGLRPVLGVEDFAGDGDAELAFDVAAGFHKFVKVGG